MSGPQRYRKKPVELDVMGPLTPENRDEIAAWCNGKAEDKLIAGPGRGLTPAIVIHTLEGDLKASYGDFVVRGVKGEHWAVKPDIFAATYEAVTE